MTDSTVAAVAAVPTSSRLRRRWLLIVAGMLMLGLILLGGIHWWLRGRFMVSTDDAYLRADIVSIAPQVAGYLSSVEVVDNQPLNRGEVVARVDDRDYRARLEEAEGAVREALADIQVRQARIALLAARRLQQGSLIAEARSSIEAAAAEAHRATQEDRRQRGLARQQVSSAQQTESAGATARQALAALAAVRAAGAAREQELTMVGTEQQAAAAESDKAQAALAQARARLTLARIAIERTLIRSPIDGVAGQRSLRAGQYVEPGMPLLAVVPQTVYVVANFKETQLDGMHAGQSVRVDVDALGGLRLHGRVDSFAPASGAQFALLPPDNATGNFTKIIQRMPVRIRLDPGQSRMLELHPGMSVIASVDTRHD